MTTSTTQGGAGAFNPYLSPDQQDLLLQALTSNDASAIGVDTSGKRASSQLPQSFDLDSMQTMNGMALNPNFFGSPQQQLQTPQSGHFGGPAGIDESPFIDYLDTDANFDFEPVEDEGAMIGGLPDGNDEDDDQGGYDGDLHDKRKSIDDYDESENGDPKRQEGEDKVAKKPGRKPLTTEPTTKRKAQNRAAQRAFRERKEKHLKDLETKVKQLEDKSKSTNHENGMLRAQVARLQTELREYRKRLSLNSSAVNRSPPLNSSFSGYTNKHNSNIPNANDFNFAFPRFGSLPGSHIFGNNAKKSTPPTAAAGILARSESGQRSVSPRSQGNTTPQSNSNAKGASGQPRNDTTVLEGIFSPSVLKTASADTPLGYFPDMNQIQSQSSDSSIDANTGPSPRIFQFNAGSASTTSHTDSPESCSTYNANTASSCTSPESNQNSPPTQKENTFVSSDGYVCHGNSQGEIEFCEMLNMACGNPRNPVPRAKSLSMPSPPANGANSGSPAANAPTGTTGNAIASIAPITNSTTAATDIGSMVNGIDWMASQNGGGFDPVLFGDYRESQDAIIGGGDFTGGFFSDAFNMATPNFGTGLSPQPVAQHDKLMEMVNKAQDGVDDEDEVVPGEDPNQMLNCNNIWNQLQENKDFQDGKIDIDNLCTELRAKARCSETGVVVDKKDVDALLAKGASCPEEAMRKAVEAKKAGIAINDVSF